MSEAARVLVVDDSAVIRSVLRKALTERGHEVFEAVDGADGVRAAHEHAPDLVLMDVEMPNLDGHGALRQLQADESTAHIPVVFLTGRTSVDDVVEGLRLGAYDYLRKPFEPEELVARVSAAWRVKKLEDELRRRNAELEALSRTDALTGLANRRHLQEQLVIATAVARRHGGRMGVLMIDVDHFKSVNDRFGHDIGDAVLREVADRLAATTRAEDLVGRWGGEEFMVVAPSTDAPGVRELGERARRAMSARPIEVLDGSITVTVSVGAAEGEGDIEQVLRDADLALYEAKASGRDRVVVAS